MEIIATPPFLTGSVTWQEHPGQWTLTVVCKVTYALKPGTSIVATEPEGINERDNHWDDDPGKCVYAPSDLAPYKPRPEVVLVGRAFAPRREPVRSLFARLVVADVDKSIEVIGPRTITRDGAVSEGPKWTQMPLRYERAAGGDDSWNPVGIDPAVVDAYGRRTLPNLQPPGLDAEGPRGIPTAGFGPIASRWLVRSAKLGALVGAFAQNTWTEAALGVDFDGSYFQSAPSDQLVEELRPDERILLENMHPEIERFSTRLPGLRPRMRVEIEGLPPWEPDFVPDTLWIDTNRAIASLTFRAQVPLDGRDQPGHIFIGAEYPGEPVRFPEPPRAALEPPPSLDDDDDDLTQTTADSLQGLGLNPLPFAASPALPFAPARLRRRRPPNSRPRRRHLAPRRRPRIRTTRPCSSIPLALQCPRGSRRKKRPRPRRRRSWRRRRRFSRSRTSRPRPCARRSRPSPASSSRIRRRPRPPSRFPRPSRDPPGPRWGKRRCSPRKRLAPRRSPRRPSRRPRRPSKRIAHAPASVIHACSPRLHSSAPPRPPMPRPRRPRRTNAKRSGEKRASSRR